MNGRGAGLKFDQGKIQPRLLYSGVPNALEEIVRVLTFGAQKYAPDSWQHVENAEERYQDASYRHDAARNKGEPRDQETGLLHRAHHIVNELFLLELEIRKWKQHGWYEDVPGSELNPVSQTTGD